MSADNDNFKTFKLQIDKFKADVKEEFDKRRKKFAIAVLINLVKSSPFKTGSYIASHRVGVSSVDFNFSSFPHAARSRAEVEASAISAGKAKINRAKLFDTIYISNSVPHAVNVELVGWKATPPYHTYGLTYEYMRHMIGRYMGK